MKDLNIEIENCYSVKINGKPTYRFIQTCCACPEQYEVVDYENSDNELAYVRYRYGSLRVDIPNGDTIYAKSIGGEYSGCFEDEEREYYLQVISNEVYNYYHPTREELIENINKLEQNLFYLDMKDTWHTRDYEEDTKLRNELSELKRQLQKLENESEEN